MKDFLFRDRGLKDLLSGGWCHGGCGFALGGSVAVLFCGHLQDLFACPVIPVYGIVCVCSTRLLLLFFSFFSLWVLLSSYR